MATIAVYSLKGGVGKTSLAVNLAFAAASRSARGTLLWDLDPQGAGTFILGSTPRHHAARVFAKEIAPDTLIQSTAFSGLDLLVPVIPMASAVEAMAERRAPLASYAPANPAAHAVAQLWTGVERRLAERG